MRKLLILIPLVFFAPSVFAQLEMGIGLEPNFTFIWNQPIGQTAGSLTYDFGTVAVESTTKFGVMGDIMLATSLGVCYDIPLNGARVIRLSTGPLISFGLMAEGMYYGGYFQAKYKNDSASSWYANTGFDFYYFMDEGRIILPTIYIGGGYSFEF